MIALRQITKTTEIIRLRDYYLLNLETTGGDPSADRITTLAMVQIRRNRIARKAVVAVAEDSEEQIASSLARLLLGSTIVGEPEQLLFLRALLESFGYEGEISFLPLLKLAYSLFPGYTGQSLRLIADFLELEVPAEEPLLAQSLLSDELLQECKEKLGGRKRRVPKTASRGRTPGSRRVQIDDQKLKVIAKQIWSVTPWQFTLGLIAAAIAILLLVPKQQSNKTVDLNSAPVNYLVISWDETGKYGKKSESAGKPIEFHIPYGVYNVLNNNSLPIEITISSEDPKNVPLVSVVGKDESNKDSEEEESGSNTIQIRPSTSREITINKEQFFTLSENADELVFFYLYEVPEEKESNSTGQAPASQVTVYKYIKGTEVRFRTGPSLESQIISTLNNGQQVQVLGVAGEWTNVKVQDKKGYIFSQFLISDNPDASPTPEAAPQAESGETAAEGEEAAPTADLPSAADQQENGLQ